MRPIATDVCGVVCVSVSLFVTLTYFAKTAEPIDIPFGVWARVGPSNHVLDGGRYPPGKGQFCEWAYMGMRQHDTLLVDIFSEILRPFIEILRSLAVVFS